MSPIESPHYPTSSPSGWLPPPHGGSVRAGRHTHASVDHGCCAAVAVLQPSWNLFFQSKLETKPEKGGKKECSRGLTSKLFTLRFLSPRQRGVYFNQVKISKKNRSCYKVKPHRFVLIINRVLLRRHCSCTICSLVDATENQKKRVFFFCSL